MVRTSLFPLFLVILVACDGGASSGTTGTGGSIPTTASTTATAGSGGADAGTGGAVGQGGATGACTSCAGACVDTRNDAQNCGACGTTCPAKQHCDHGACGSPLCLVQGAICPNDHLCCGDECCPAWKMCCNVPGGDKPICVPVDAGACPSTCAACP
ncbi:MAG: hypothetical protein QM820_25085 [Minicystis sp.]